MNWWPPSRFSKAVINDTAKAVEFDSRRCKWNIFLFRQLITNKPQKPLQTKSKQTLRFYQNQTQTIEIWISVTSDQARLNTTLVIPSGISANPGTNSRGDTSFPGIHLPKEYHPYGEIYRAEIALWFGKQFFGVPSKCLRWNVKAFRCKIMILGDVLL